jgi:outer membrane receptor protein involved in Fe transport
MTIRIILQTLLFVLLSTAAYSQDLTIHGKVMDAKSKEVLEGAVVRTTSGRGVAANSNGEFTLKYRAPKDTLIVSMLGYKDVTRVLTSADDQTTLTLLLTSIENELKVVVVSAGKFEQDISEVTVSMEVIPENLVTDKNTVSIDEILQQTPGVSIVNKEPQIRSGSGFSFGAGSRVQILVDDIPVLSGDAGRPAWGFLPVENLSQIEVIKGASSVLYGSAALSGVVNLRTAYPTDTSKTVLTLYHGFYSAPQSDSAKYWKSTSMRSGLNFLHSEKFGQLDVVLGASYLGDDGHLGPIKDSSGGFEDKYNPFNADRYNATNRMRMNTNLRYRSKNIIGLSYGINTNWMLSNSLATLLWENSATGLYGAYNGSATRTKQTLGTIDPFVTYHSRKGHKHSLRTRWQTLDNNNDNNQGNYSDVYYAEYQYQQNWDSVGIKNFTTTLGVVGIHTDATGELFTGGNTDGRNSANNYATYLQLDKKFFDKLNVSAGVRYEYFDINKTSSSKPVFRAGANYQVHKATYVRASYGQGYRFPSIAEKYIVTGVGAINIFANPDLIAETSYNAEIGIKQGFKIGNFLGFLDIAAFQQEYENFIEFTFGQWKYVRPISGIDDFGRFAQELQESIGFKSVNTGKAKIQGLEVSVMGQGNIGNVTIQTLAGYTYTKPQSTSPDYVYGLPPNGAFTSPRIPPTYTYGTTSSDPANNILKYRMQHLVRADISASWRSWMLGVSGRYNSHVQNIDRAFGDLEESPMANFNPGLAAWRERNTKGDYVFDARIAYELSPRHRFAIIVNNVLNREYAIRPLAIEEPRVTVIQYMLSL